MRCSICGKNGHNARTCPYKDKDVPKDRALWLKVDHLTEREETELLLQFIKDKGRIAPEARATSAKGNAKELPDRIRKALQLPEHGGKNGSKKKR